MDHDGEPRSREGQEDGQRSVDGDHGAVIEVAEGLSHPLSLHRHGLVYHDLGAPLQAILGGRLHIEADQWGIDPGAGEQQHRHTAGSGKLIRLDDEGGTRLPEVTRNGDGH